MEKKERPVYTATHIANYFIENLEYVDNIRLNKLVYIAYGLYYAYFNKGLFNETIQAWKLGPVIPSIYHDFKHYGNEKITEPSYIFVDFNFDEKEIPKINKSDEDVKGILDAVIEVYGRMSASSLIDRTHKKDTPWEKSYQKGFFYIEIDKEDIKSYYKKLVGKDV